MAVAALSPVKILSDLGYEVWEMENNADMRSALIEAINTLTLTNPSDGRIPVLHDAVKNIQRPKFKTKRISAGKMMGRKASSSQKVAPQKLLPGTSEGDSVNKNALASRLNNISKSLDNLGNVLRQQLGIEKASAKQKKKSNDEASKKRREEELEEKKQKKGGSASGKVVNALKAPFTGLFGAAKKFFGNIVAGSAILGLMKWLKSMDDATFGNFIKNLQEKAGWVLAGIIGIAALGLIGHLSLVTLGLIGGLTLLAPAIPLLLKAMAIAAAAVGTIMAGKWLWDKGKEAVQGAAGFIHSGFAGGDASAAGDIANEAELRKSGVSQNWLDRRMGRYTLHTRKIDPNTGKMSGFVESKGYDELSKEQKAAVDKFNAESKRMNDLEKERNRKIKELRKSLWEGPEGGTWKYAEGYWRTPWNKVLTEEGKEKQKEINKKARQTYLNYEGRISGNNTTPPPANLGNKNVSSPNINQPLQGDQNTNLINLGGEGGGNQGSSGSAGGNETPSFSSSSGRLGNEITIGAGNN